MAKESFGQREFARGGSREVSSYLAGLELTT
jgi:hypothetical protein